MMDEDKQDNTHLPVHGEVRDGAIPHDAPFGDPPIDDAANDVRPTDLINPESGNTDQEDE